MDYKEFLVQMAKQLSDPSVTVTDKFRKNVEMFKLNTYSDKVYLYIGGPLWDPKAISALRDVLKAKTHLKDRIGIIRPDGSRYCVTDISTTLRMEGGGRASKNKKCTSRKTTQ